MFTSVRMHLKIVRIKKKKFGFPEINMYNIVLLLVRFGKFLNFAFLLLKWYRLVQDGRFSG